MDTSISPSHVAGFALPCHRNSCMRLDRRGRGRPALHFGCCLVLTGFVSSANTSDLSLEQGPQGPGGRCEQNRQQGKIHIHDLDCFCPLITRLKIKETPMPVLLSRKTLRSLGVGGGLSRDLRSKHGLEACLPPGWFCQGEVSKGTVQCLSIFPSHVLKNCPLHQL